MPSHRIGAWQPAFEAAATVAEELVVAVAAAVVVVVAAVVVVVAAAASLEPSAAAEVDFEKSERPEAEECWHPKQADCPGGKIVGARVSMGSHWQKSAEKEAMDLTDQLAKGSLRLQAQRRSANSKSW